MDKNDFLVLESDNKMCCAFTPAFEAKVGDLADTVENGMCRVVYRFYDPEKDVIAALTEAYGTAHVKAVYRKEWEVTE